MLPKNRVLILVILCIVPILKGYDSHSSFEYGILFMEYQLSSMHMEYYQAIFPLASVLGALIGGFAIDKWNVKRFILISLIALSGLSLLLQFYDTYPMILIQRWTLGFSFGLFSMTFQVFITDIADFKNRGKYLFTFLQASIVGSVLYLVFRYFFLVKSDNYNFTYPQYQIPYIILPLLILLVYRYFPDRRKSGTVNTNSSTYLFKFKQKVIIIVMVILAMLTTFANSNMHVYVSSQITFNYNIEFLYLIPMLLGILATTLGIVFIDTVGRKRLLIFGIVALIISSIMNLCVPLITENQLIVFGFLQLYNFLFSFTIITTSFIIILEYLPSQIRGRGMLLFSLIYWMPNGIYNILNTTLIFDSKYNVIISSLISLPTLIISLFLIQKYLIETKGLKLEEIKSKINIE